MAIRLTFFKHGLENRRTKSLKSIHPVPGIKNKPTVGQNLFHLPIAIHRPLYQTNYLIYTGLRSPWDYHK